MRSFRARIERGRIIVHEPIDLPDGVISLLPIEVGPVAAPSDAPPAEALPVEAPRSVAVEPPAVAQRSSS
jgi:hypothetical protein